MELFFESYKKYYNSGSYQGLKGYEYYLHKCREYYSQYAHESGAITNAASSQGASRRSARELRDYGRGLQPIDKYLTQIGYNAQEVEKFKKANISHAPAPIYSKFRNIIAAKFADLNLKPNTEAMNEEANIERMFKRNRMKLLRQQETRMAAPPGTLPKDEMQGVSDPKDIDYLYDMGEVRLSVEIMAKDALDITFERSKWPTINKMLIEDYIDLGGMAVDQYMLNGMVVVDYVDYARVIARPSIYPDFRDSDMRGYIRNRKVSEIMMIDEGAVRNNWSSLKQAYYNKPSGMYATYNKNHGIREDYANRGQWSGLSQDFGVTEVKLYWVDIDEQWFVKGRHPRGSRIFEAVDPGFNLSKRAERAGKTLEKYAIQKIYTATHILGTDIVYNYGEVDTVVRQGEPGAKELIWPLQIYAAQEPSLTEKVVPFLDDINLAIYKRRDVMSKIPPGPRMVLYKNRIRESITMGGETYNIRDLMKMYYREGLLIVDQEEEYTMPGEEGPKGRPIDFIPAGVSEDIQIAETTIISSLNRIRDITGINEVVDGTSANPDMLKSVVESLKLAANNALRPWLEGYVEFYRNISSSLVWKYQTIAATGARDLGTLPMSQGTSKLVRIGPELLRYNLNVKVEVNDSQYYQFLMQDLMNKREMIPVESYFMIYNALNQGDLRKAELYLIKFTQLAQERQHQRQLEIAQATAQANAQAAQATEQMKMQAIERELMVKAQLYSAEYAAKDEFEAKGHAREIELIRIKKELEKENAVAVTEANNANRLTQQ